MIWVTSTLNPLLGQTSVTFVLFICAHTYVDFCCSRSFELDLVSRKNEHPNINSYPIQIG